MSTDRQKSFIANLSAQDHQMHFLGVMLGDEAYVSSPTASGGWFTGKRREQDHSHMLGLRPGNPKNSELPLTLYFRHSKSAYTLYIRTPGPFYRMCIGSNNEGLFGAVPPRESTHFTLLNINSSDFNIETTTQDTISLYLKAKHSGFMHAQTLHNSKHIHIGDRGGEPWPFTLNILERNAPYINRPNEV